MHSLVNRIQSLGLPPDLQIIIIAALPILELRGAIPYGVWVLKMHPLRVLVFALMGNLLVIIPLLFILDIIMEHFKQIEIGRRLIERVKNKGKIIEKLEVIGLFLFVAIPLPGTGAWTGALAAFVFGIRKHLAMPAISIGVIVAGLIVTLIVSLGTLQGIAVGILFLAGMSKMLDYIISKR